MSEFLRLLCVPGVFGAIGKALIRQIRSRFDGLRVDVSPADSLTSHETRWEQVRCYQHEDVFVDFLIGPHHIDLKGDELVRKCRDFCVKLVDTGYRERGRLAIEVGNEPDLAVDRWSDDPKGMGLCFTDCFNVIRDHLPDVPVLSPSISNLNRRGLGYLEKMVPYLPEGCMVAFHRYPNGPHWDTPHDGFTSRVREVEALEVLAGQRGLWNTETGWAEENGDHSLTESQVAERMVREDAFWRNYCRGWSPYQINSAAIGPKDSRDVRRLKTYGARRADESWKPWGDQIGGLSA